MGLGLGFKGLGFRLSEKGAVGFIGWGLGGIPRCLYLVF